MNTACGGNFSSGREYIHKLFQAVISDTKKKWKIMCTLNSALIFFLVRTGAGDDDDTK